MLEDYAPPNFAFKRVMDVASRTTSMYLSKMRRDSIGACEERGGGTRTTRMYSRTLTYKHGGRRARGAAHPEWSRSVHSHLGPFPPRPIPT